MEDRWLEKKRKRGNEDANDCLSQHDSSSSGCVTLSSRCCLPQCHIAMNAAEPAEFPCSDCAKLITMMDTWLRIGCAVNISSLFSRGGNGSGRGTCSFQHKTICAFGCSVLRHVFCIHV